MATNRLGKGLGALLGTEVDVNGGNDERFVSVDIKKIKPNPNQARKTFNDDEINELADSIKKHGIIQPVLLSENGEDGYIIIAGERRYRAAKKAGLKQLPSIIKKLTPEEIMEVSLIENLQRVDLNPIEEAMGIKELMDVCGITQEQAAERLGRGRPSITNSLRLLKLPPTVLNMVQQDKLSKGHAKCLLGVDDTELLIYLAEKAVKEGLSVRALEQLIASTGNTKKIFEKKQKIISSQMKDVENRLCDRLATKVTLSGSEKRGTIKIDYFSTEELNGILDKIL